MQNFGKKNYKFGNNIAFFGKYKWDKTFRSHPICKLALFGSIIVNAIPTASTASRSKHHIALDTKSDRSPNRDETP